MQRVAIKAYAVKHKLSIFNVIKMVKSGKLKTDIVEENGKEVTYILIEEGSEDKVVPIKSQKKLSLEEEVTRLRNEVELLRKELEELKKKL